MAGAGNPAQTGNVFQQSAGALATGVNAAQQAAQFQPQQVGTQFGYSPQNVGTSFGYRPQTVSGNFNYRPDAVSANRGYTAERVGTQFGYSPDAVSADQAVGGISTYMNPYTQQVIDTSMADLERQRQMQANQIGAQAAAAGAFGGSREGVAQALTNEAFARQGGQLAAGLRQQGFQTALGASQQDIANQMQADLANQAARARASEFGQSTSLQAQSLNQAAANAAAQFAQERGLQADLANQAARARAAEFGRSTGLQASMADQAARARAAEFGQSTGLQAQSLNQAARSRAAEFGQSTALQAALANQRAAEQAAATRLSAAGQLGQLSNLGFGQGMAINQQQLAQGLAMQAMNQQLIDAARQQYAGFVGSPERALQLPIQAVTAGNMGQGTSASSGTASQQPGLLNYLSLGASLFASDSRLKTNVQPYAERNGIKFYTWDWNEEGRRVADPAQPTIGVMADELQEIHPHLVHRGADGYLRVDYGGLAAELGAA